MNEFTALQQAGDKGFRDEVGLESRIRNCGQEQKERCATTLAVAGRAAA